jgi:hypothetical protein
MNNNESLDAIRANLQVMYSYIDKAKEDVLTALLDIQNGNQNGAIGAIIEVPDRLEASKALCEAAMRIHRNSRTF